MEKLTGILLEDFSNYVVQEHIMRYVFASKLSKGLVLDVACGTGYGSAYLSEKGSFVVGVDISKKALSIAKKHYCKAEFVLADAIRLPFRENVFDTVISFETIEHIKNYLKFLSETQRVLKEDGLFICSTPNVKYTMHPHYHVKEFYPQEFFKTLEKFFKSVERYGQYISIFLRVMDLARYVTGNMISSISKVLLHLLPSIKNSPFVMRFKNRTIKRKGIKSLHKIKDSFETAFCQHRVVRLGSRKGLLRIMVAVCRNNPSVRENKNGKDRNTCSLRS